MTSEAEDKRGGPVKPLRRSSQQHHQQQHQQQPTTVAASKPLRLRIALVGAEGSGKSCIIKRYCEKRFVSRHQPTVGIDYGATRIYVDKREVSVHVFDTSGSPLFKEVRNEFYRDAHGIVLVFDVTDRASFDSLCDWTKEIYTELARGGRDFSSTVLMLCCNKCDLTPCQVDDVEARLWAELRGFPFFEASALTGEGVNDMFHAFFSQVVRLHDDGASGLPRTPSSARKVQVSGSSSSLASASKRNSSHFSRAPSEPSSDSSAKATTKQPLLPQPSPEQRTVMSRLRESSDPWQQLGLGKTCTQDEVNRVFRRLAVLLHPDKTAVAGADEAFKALGVARRNILRAMGIVS